MCGGGNMLGKILGAAAGGFLGGPLGAAAGFAAGEVAVDQPQEVAKQGLEQQKAANRTAVDAAARQADAADQAMNRANGKAPDMMGMMDANKTQAKGGQSGTMLTGTSGVDPASLLLSKKTLLGA